MFRASIMCCKELQLRSVSFKNRCKIHSQVRSLSNHQLLHLRQVKRMQYQRLRRIVRHIIYDPEDHEVTSHEIEGGWKSELRLPH
jgi:hypothetical protein